MNQHQEQPPQQQQQQQPQQQHQQQPSSQPQINDDQKKTNEDDCQSNGGFIVKMCGLPWSATANDIINFLNTLGEAKVKGGVDGVHITLISEGRPSGDAFVEMESEEDLKAALKKNLEHMGSRYIEVFRSTRPEMEWFIERTVSALESGLDDHYVVHLRGLPFKCTEDDIAQFFKGLEMTPGGISIATDYTGRSTGEAFVQFVNRDNREKALLKHTNKIGYRYIEVFRSSLAEIHKKTLQRRPGQTPYNRKGRFASSGGGSGRSLRYFDMPMRTRRNKKSFCNNGFDNGDDTWNSGRSMGGPKGGGKGGYGMVGDSSDGIGEGGWNSNNWNAPPSRPLNVLHMKGLPCKANKDDIATFFEPLKPVDIHILFNNNEPSGEANVEFGNKEDAMQAMSKDKTFMQHRYIELFKGEPVGDRPGSTDNNFSMDDMGPPNSGNGGSFRGYGNNSFGGGGSSSGGGGPSEPRNTSGPGPKFNPF